MSVRTEKTDFSPRGTDPMAYVANDEETLVSLTDNVRVDLWGPRY